MPTHVDTRGDKPSGELCLMAPVNKAQVVEKREGATLGVTHERWVEQGLTVNKSSLDLMKRLCKCSHGTGWRIMDLVSDRSLTVCAF